MKKILFICTGNICRSPMAEAVLRKMAQDANVSVRVDSAGVGGWHTGEQPDNRAAAAAISRGYDLSGIAARQIAAKDLTEFDVIYAMAKEHQQFLLELPEATPDKVQLFLSPARGDKAIDVPDPYYGGETGFEMMMDLLEEGCAAIIAAHSIETKK